jgi:Ca2+/H+ antiporter, TMEM165/GDT1 family
VLYLAGGQEYPAFVMWDFGVIVAAYLGASVEWVEAFTIVLAVSLSIGWIAAAGAAAAALVVLAGMTVFGTALLSYIPDLAWVQGVIGLVLILFGVRWLGKAIARGAGLKARHDELVEFESLRANKAIADRRASWMIAFNGTLLEGLEVWLIVVALGVQTHHTAAAAAAAIAALLVVVAVGAMLRRPLARVPENAIKFFVGGVILSFGTFWVLEALGYAWPLGDAALPLLAAFYLLGGLGLVNVMKTPPVKTGAIP